jgi:hypothetical protein
VRLWVIGLLIMGIVSSQSVAGELTLTRISATFGTIQSLQSQAVEYSNVFYPELQVQGDLFARGIGWETFWGYWDDGITQVQVVDAIVYNSTGHMVGLRISFDPKQLEPNFLLPVVVWSGLAHHFISLEDLGATDYTGAHGTDQSVSANSWEVGARSNIGITEQVSLRIEVRQLFYVGDPIPGLPKDERLNYGVGIGFGF